MKSKHLRTWIEINRNALEHNVRQFLKLIPARTRLMAVVKSNAYGHGIVQVAEFLANQMRINSRIFANKNSRLISDKLWFGVDSIVEALRLREEGIKNPILVLGSTLPNRMKEAAEQNIILTVSNFESLSSLIRANKRIAFHLKIDTGMHRQGFLPKEMPRLLRVIGRWPLAVGRSFQGVYTHFASAKDRAYPTYTLQQFGEFKTAVRQFEKAGYKNLMKHAAASGGALLFPQAHLDMVRIGIGLYGCWPSPETEAQYSLPVNRQHATHSSVRLGTNNPQRFELNPVLTWKTIVSEVKEIPTGSFVGYDLTERVHRKTKIAILPVGYWHGIDRGLSSIGEVLIHKRRRKIIGRVSMDMVVVDVTDAPAVSVGAEAVLIGKQGKERIAAEEIALRIGSTSYEVLTRINPLIERNMT